MATTALAPIRICRNGGPITSDVWKAYYSAGTAATEDWKAGEILYLVGGYIKRIGTFNSAGQLDTDDAGFNSAYRHFLALEDHDASADGKADYVAVQEILNDTELEIQIAASGATAPTVALLRTTLATYKALSLYKSAADVMGADVDTADTKGVLSLIDADDTTEWMKEDEGAAGTNGSGKKIRAKLIQSVQL